MMMPRFLCWLLAEIGSSLMMISIGGAGHLV